LSLKLKETILIILIKKSWTLKKQGGKIMAKATVEIPDDRFVQLDEYKDRLGELLSKANGIQPRWSEKMVEEELISESN
jgi:hypothetical protein